jgi:hypothetical protein
MSTLRSKLSTRGGHKGIIKTVSIYKIVSISTKTVGAAGNDAKFLTSSRSSAHIPNNFWSWTILSQAKEEREVKDKVEVGAKKESDHKGLTLPESNQLETLQGTHI